ncbi:hypothetical protein PILCRDRAFT_810896 [Piloderma croceum F 1598]|uniref:Phosphodiesterase n=1 Tax=Piloderma croceum (strain F 1598) TaxID=765440 RepID=A0A0C3GM81_PILCF|nr:hypothetical protein PILCRDRAFT_810896 [Piloderma croceum F 1598]
MTDQDGCGHGRRRSVDVGGLALALGNQGLGHGWGGWEERELGEVRYAELLSEMYTQTQTTVNHYHIQSDSASLPPEICLATRQRLIESLDSWNFEPHKLPDEEVLCCTLILFETLFCVEGMDDDIGIPLSQISEFLRHLRTVYRRQNSYHNFQHALDVLQATQTFLCAAKRVPPVSILLGDDRTWRPDKSINSDDLTCCLDNLDLFALYIAAIGHDVGHPGFTNVFMKNAKTPLSAVYDDKSALEQMHYALLLQIMRHNGLGDILDRPHSGVRIRKLLSAVVLATDMSVHFDFMKNFTLLVRGTDHNLLERTTLLCQALIKCADISNPSRPHGVSQHWASALSEEWTSQVHLEEHFHLPSTVQPSTNPLGEAKSQIFFINTFAKPLLDLTAKAIPEMEPFAEQCTSNLRTWETRAAELIAAAPAAARETPSRSVSPSRLPENFFTAFPMTIPTHFLTPEEQAEAFGTWHPTECSSASSDASSEHSYPLSETQSVNFPSTSQFPSIHSAYIPTSPLYSPSESVGSSLLSPREQSGLSHHQRPSSAGSSSGVASEATTAIRAAYHASVRKKRSMNRNSWNACNQTPPSSPPPVPPKFGLVKLVRDSDMHESAPACSTGTNGLSTLAHTTPSISSTVSTAGPV